MLVQRRRPAGLLSCWWRPTAPAAAVRKPRRAHDLIDVYGLDGGYRRSYRLPVDTDAMATVDGRTFYVLTPVERMYPHLFGLTLEDET